jgi:branched-chain amino acid transport system ATP-binding protein
MIVYRSAVAVGMDAVSNESASSRNGLDLPSRVRAMALLEVEQVTVTFGGVRALDQVDLDVDAGSVTGLIGPNGAGKTTLFNVICGLQAHASGHVRLDGHDLARVAPHRRARRGIARTFQRLEVFGSMSARDNIRVAADVHRRWDRSAPPPEEITERILDRVGLRSVAGGRVDTLPTGHARLVEVGRALATQPRVLLLDEPSSGLDEEETDSFADLLRSLAADGMATLLVEHDIELVMKVCARIHVLDFGRTIAVGSPAEVQQDHAVQEAYLGTVGTG